MFVTISDFIDLCIDSSMFEFAVYSFEKGSVIYKGYANDIPEELADLEIAFFDVPCEETFTINVD